MGDVVLTQPVAAILRKKYPQARLHYITKKAFLPLVHDFGCIDQIHIWEDYKSYAKLRKLHKIGFDLIVDLHNKLNTFLIKNIVNGKRTATYSKKHNLRRRIVQHKTSTTISSTVELYLSALRKSGLEVQLQFPRLFPKIAENDIIQKLKESGKILIGIFPGALHNTKQYPVQQMADLICQSSPNYKFVLLGAPNELELARELILLSKPDVINLCGKMKISELINAINTLDVIISNDSGPMHIAAALQKPQIAIFGATHPKLGFAPLNKNAVVLKADLDCQPCSLHGSKQCPLKHYNCMKSIKSSQIIEALTICTTK